MSAGSCDKPRAYAFARQPEAAAVNVRVLSEAFVWLVQQEAKEEGLQRREIGDAVARVHHAATEGFQARRPTLPRGAPTPPTLRGRSMALHRV